MVSDFVVTLRHACKLIARFLNVSVKVWPYSGLLGSALLTSVVYLVVKMFLGFARGVYTISLRGNR